MNNKAFSIKKILLTLLFFLLLAFCLSQALRLTARKDSQVKYADFMDHASEIDVLFLGSSHVINGVNPVELFEAYGYTSYNMGGHGSVMQETYWELMLALDYCTPKVVVVDAYMLDRDYQYIDEMYEHSSDSERASSISQLHLNMDIFPLNDTKRAALQDLVADRAVQRQFYYPQLLYHARWSELSAEDYAFFTPGGARNPLLGCELRYDVETREEPPERIGEAAAMETPTVGVSYLIRILEECKGRDVPVLLTFLPLYGSVTDENAAAGARLIAESYNVPYLNYYDNAFPDVDVHADFNDHGHLNVTGCEKVTATIGQTLQTLYGQILVDHREDPVYAFWQDRAADYAQKRHQSRIDAGTLYAQLNQLHARFSAPDADGGYIVFVRFSSEAYYDAGLRHLIGRLRALADLRDDLNVTWEAGQSYLLIDDALLPQGAVEVCGTSRTLSGIRTSLGSMSYYPLDVYCLLSCDLEPEVNLLDMEEHYDADVQILIYDGKGEILSHTKYYHKLNAYESR